MYNTKIIALDLEGTLISNAMSQIARPHLYDFLEGCKKITDRVVMYTTISESKFREIAILLVSEGSAPKWFATMEYVNWTGVYKNLNNIENVNIEKTLLVDDYLGYIDPEQKENWIEIENYANPYSQNDTELLLILNKLKV